MVNLRCRSDVTALANAVVALKNELPQLLPFVACQVFVIAPPPLCILLELLAFPPIPFFAKFLALFLPPFVSQYERMRINFGRVWSRQGVPLTAADILKALAALMAQLPRRKFGRAHRDPNQISICM
jgi:hypothetical protein